MPGSVGWIPFEACAAARRLLLSLLRSLSFCCCAFSPSLLCIPAWSSLGPWVQSQLHKALHLVLCVCVFFFFSLFEILGSLVWLGMILLRRRCLWEICVCRLGWIAVAGQCMRRRRRRRRRSRRRRRRNLVLCVLLALSSFVEILRGIPLNEFFDGWGSEIASVCLFFLQIWVRCGNPRWGGESVNDYVWEIRWIYERIRGKDLQSFCGYGAGAATRRRRRRRRLKFCCYKDVKSET